MMTWILLRGLARESAHWGEFPRQLRQRLADAVVVALDLPGTGRHHLVESPARIELTAQWCREEVRRLGLTPPYRLLAISMGGMVALEWVRLDPDAIAGCVLINTSLRPIHPWHWRLRPANYGALLRLAWPGTSDAAHEATILRMTSHNRAAADQVFERWVRLRRDRPVSGRNAWRQLLAAARFRYTNEAPALPMLILASSADRLVDVRCSVRLANRWQAEVALHPDAGHDLPLDDCDWVVERVADWAARS